MTGSSATKDYPERLVTFTDVRHFTQKRKTMKAPDKIYIERDRNGRFSMPYWSEDPYLGHFEKVEYIRKDFLMERLARAKELRERHSSNPNTLREYIAPIDALMNMINSL